MEEQKGRIVTFYSYKGGVGRSFALANIALLLAAWGQRILCVDWDLDAPGLSYYFRPYLTTVKTGLLELIEGVGSGRNIDWRSLANPIKVELRDQEISIDLIAAGGEGESYAGRVQELSWPELYTKHDLGTTIERLRDEWTSSYDTVLVDSRTGITDIGAICTAQLPDIVVLGFTANHQSLDGAIAVMQKARAARNRLSYDRSGLLTLPMPCRFDSREEYKQSSYWREEFARRLQPFYAPWLPPGVDHKRILEHTTIPYFSYWSFGEQLAVVSEQTTNPDLVSYYFETLAALLAHALDRAELLVESRSRYIQAARRVGTTKHLAYDVYLSGTTELSDLAQAIAQALQVDGIRVIRNQDAAIASEWSSQLDSLTDNARFLVPLIGLESAKSRWQQAEIRSFMSAATDPSSPHTIIPILVEPAALDSLPTLFRSLQSIDGRSGPQQIAADLLTVIRSVSSET